ncbi:MAG: hypothetical protein LUG85_03550, partial [Clostridiales bacterium]|nr:hypothetical protein [Clostridiales bacterium]
VFGNNVGSVVTLDSYTDLFGGNYHTNYSGLGSAHKYMQDSFQESLTKPYIGTETASAVNSRGVYSYSSSNYQSSPYACRYCGSYQINSYDSQTINWGETASTMLWYSQTNDWFSGEYIWTGFDYLGEPTPWNSTGAGSSLSTPNSSYFGTVDTAGFAKDSYYLYRSVWNDSSTTLHLLPGTWNESSLSIDSDGYVNVAIYSNAYKVELYLGDDLIGSSVATETATDAGHTYRTYEATVENETYCKELSMTTYYGNNAYSSDIGAELYTQFAVFYDSTKTLSVKAYDESGNEITDTVGTTSVYANEASAISLEIWGGDATATADGDSFKYIEITAVDENGNFVNDYNGTVTIDLTGVGEIVGVDNGNAATTEKGQQSSVLTSDTTANIALFNGKAVVVVKSTEETGEISVSVTAADLSSTETVTITSQAETGDELTDEFEEVVDQSSLTLSVESSELYEYLSAAIPELSDGSSYILYTPDKSETEYLPDGSYVLVSESSDGSTSTGVMCIDGSDNVLTSGGDAEASSYVWSFTRQDDGTYIVSCTDSDVTLSYLNITESGITIGKESQNLTVVYGCDSITIGSSDGYYITYSADSSNAVDVSADGGSSFSLYTVSGGEVSRWTGSHALENGNYVIYSDYNPYAMSTTETSVSGGTDSSDGLVYGFELAEAEVSGTELTTAGDANTVEWVFEYIAGTGNHYYVMTHDGQYLNVGVYGVVTLSDEPVELVLYLNDEFSSSDEDRIALSDVDATSYLQKRSGSIFSTGRRNTVAQSQLLLYKDQELSEDMQSLYNALLTYIQVDSSIYSAATYSVLISVLYDGYEIYISDNVTDEQAAAATAAIEAAYAALEATDRQTIIQDEIVNMTRRSGDETLTAFDYYDASSGVEDGTYLISLNSTSARLMYNTIRSSTAGTLDAGTKSVTSGTVTISDTHYMYEFTLVDGTTDQYYIYNLQNGQYLNIGDNSSSNYVLMFSDEPQAITVTTNTDGSVYISADTAYLYGGTASGVGGGWYTSTSATKIRLYKSQTDDEAIDSLYDAMLETAYYDSTLYTEESFAALLDAIEAGIAVYEDESSADEDYAAAETAIWAAVDALEVFDYAGYLRDQISALEEFSTTVSENTFEKYTDTTVLDGVYMITAPASSSTTVRAVYGAYDSTGLNSGSFTPADDGTISTTMIKYIFSLVLVEGTTDQYYIQCIGYDEDQYMVVDSSDKLNMSATPQALTVTVNDDGTIAISSGSNYDTVYYVKGPTSGNWTAVTSTDIAITLYRATTDDLAKADLYDKLVSAVATEQDNYTSTSYNNLVDAIAEALAVYNDENSDQAAYTAAAAAISAAEQALRLNTVIFNAVLYKYGYNTSDKTYSYGGRDFNAQTYAKMAEYISSSTELVNQIKTIIGYDTDYADTTYADAALETAIDYYAELYSLAFASNAVGNSYQITFNNGTESGSTAAATAALFYRTYWNIWRKGNSTAYSGNTTTNDGASVQGIFSTTLINGLPGMHDAYDTLEYTNDYDRGQLGNLKITLTTGDGTTSNYTLTALNNISVYVPDYFSENNAAGDDANVSDDGYMEYSKYYWDTTFSFLATTNEYGVTTYTYDSSDTSYNIQVDFNDEEQTADAYLISSSENLTVKNGSTSKTGFFPFNYRLDGDNADAATTENAVYHFGMSFSTDFYIPTDDGHTYSDGSDIVFSFSGDDDVLVYVDDVLVLDNGGLHGARAMSVNFSTMSVSYQIIGDLETQTILNSADDSADYITYTYGETNTGISDQNQAAIDYLNKIANDGEVHTVRFYYLERGSTDSNAYIQFNLQKVSDYLVLDDQSYVADYGLPIKVEDETEGIKSNNINLTDNYVNESDKLTYEYIGIADKIPTCISAGEYFGSDFEDILVNTSGGQLFTADTTSLTHTDSYGVFVMNSDGTFSYTPTTMTFNYYDYLYVFAKVYNDPTYEDGVVYYAYEKITVIPATTVYYEDDFEGTDGMTYTDGTIAGGSTSGKGYGVWSTVTGTGTAADSQAADLVGDVKANIYGYDSSYDSFATYSNNSAHVVTVSSDNNSKLSGNSGASWPTATFTFAGTGFDVISVTSADSGAVLVTVKDSYDTVVKNVVVNNYYGYSYGKIYADEEGNATLTDTGVEMYLTDVRHYTTNITYYQSDGSISSNPTDSIAYAYGWLADSEATSDNALYQIPVISIEDLDYGTYTVTITPMYSSTMDIRGAGSYKIYVDAIRIYNPAGTGSSLTSSTISYAYTTDGEANPYYLEIRDMLIGTNEFSNMDADTANGIVFVDGISANENVSDYTTAGPNNEVYLDTEQAVAFEIWASKVPDDLQIGMKAIGGTSPDVAFTYYAVNASADTNTTYIAQKTLTTSTEMYYSLSSLLSTNLNWILVKDSEGNTVYDSDGNPYYTTGTIVIKNAGSGILSLTNLKWTFPSAGIGYYNLLTNADDTETDESAAVATMVTASTYSLAASAISMSYADLSIDKEDVSVESAKVGTGESIVINITTSTDVSSLVIQDEDGNIITADEIESFTETIDDEEVVQWTVTLSETESGTYTYTILGAYENGYTDSSNAVTVTVTVADAEDGDAEESFLNKLIGFFNKLVDFFKRLIALLTGTENQ